MVPTWKYTCICIYKIARFPEIVDTFKPEVTSHYQCQIEVGTSPKVGTDKK